MITRLVDHQPAFTWIDRDSDPQDHHGPLAVPVLVLPAAMSAAIADRHAASIMTDSLDDATWEDAEWR